MSAHAHASETTETSDATDTSVIGVDLGLQRLLVAAPPTDDPDIEGALVVDGNPSWALYDELDAQTGEEPDADTVEDYAEVINAHLQLAADRFGAYLDHHRPETVAIEHLSYPDYEDLADAIASPADAGAYLLPEIRARVVEAAHDRGLSVAEVSRGRTSRICHVCGESASKRRDYTVRCETEGCPADGVCSDRAAAVTIAKRAAAANDALAAGGRGE